MKTSTNRKLGAIAVAVVALVGVGAAVAASKLNGGSHTANAVAGGFGAVPNQGSQNQGTPNQGTPPSGGPFGRSDGNGGFRRGGLFGGLSAAASYLGISQQQLFTQIRSGKTLAQIANATSGKSASGLIDAMVAEQKSNLDAAVKSGRITQAMAAQIESNLKSRVTSMVNGQFGPGRGGFGDRGSGPPGGFNGTPPGSGQGQPQNGTSL
jgi:hypothetical protein